MHWEELSAELTVDEKLGIIKTEDSIPVDDKLLGHGGVARHSYTGGRGGTADAVCSV